MEETRNCQNCKKDFTIEPEDFSFYDKINVPPPTFCPECRLVRRLQFQNERTFYKRPCDLCAKETIMIFPSDSERTVYCSECWWSDKWDPSFYGMDIDFSKPFLLQFKELLDRVPMLGINNILSTMVNSDYCSICSYLKNCYLCFNSDYDEDCAYSTYLEESKRCLDMYMSMLCEMCYMSSNCYKCYKVYYSHRCNESMNIWFSRDLDGCSDCFGCVNLKNKQYYIYNEPYAKEEYFAKLKEFNLLSRKSIEELESTSASARLKFPRKYMEGLKSVNVTGDYIFSSKNVFQSYEISTAEDCKYCQFLILDGTKDSYDYTMWGMNPVRLYECMGAGNNSSDLKFIYESWSSSSNLQYCWNIFTSCHYLFGCVALKNKEYSVLNKQYSKEEYETLVPKIIQHMKDMPYIDEIGHIYSYGEFFPPEFSSHAYNETVAQKYFPLRKEDALQKGCNWRDVAERNYVVTLKSEDIPDNISDVTDSILEEVIECSHKGSCTEQCTSAFRITKEELEFYRSLELPIPRFCPNCRHYQIVNQHYPIYYNNRTCDCQKPDCEGKYSNLSHHEHGSEPCQNTFITTYPPDAPEIVYCETCYQQEVV
jgi:hypothetical protein